jgi:hypothetical protein
LILKKGVWGKKLCTGVELIASTPPLNSLLQHLSQISTLCGNLLLGAYLLPYELPDLLSGRLIGGSKAIDVPLALIAFSPLK